MTRLFGCQGDDGEKLDWPLLAEAVCVCWGWPTLPETARSERGKPFFPARPGYWFSLSHSGGYALCALSDDGPVGADIELVRAHRPKLFDLALTDPERNACQGDWGEFCRVWTLKESWCKREDIPLWPPRALATPPPCPHRSYKGEGWWASVCCTGEAPGTIEWMEREFPQIMK